jgi:hypothetical protein
MKCQKTVGRLTAVLALVVSFSVDAAAQLPAPALSVVAVGNVVTIDIGGIPGVPQGLVQGHTLSVGMSPGGSEIGSINLPASVTHIVVNAPNGTYYMRVQAYAGPYRSGISPDVSVTAGLPVCTGVPIAPVVTPTVTGGTITLDWTPIAGASHYDVMWGMLSGQTLLTDSVSTVKHSRYAGVLGNFFVRVRVNTPCGSADSAEVPFTIASLEGSGQRTPNPPPNQLLPMPSYGPAVVDQVARTYRSDLAVACHHNTTWLFKLVRELRKYDTRWGLNWKRGHPGTMSVDIITYNPSSDPDEGAQEVYLVDVIGAVCEGNDEGFNWEGVTRVTWAAGKNGDPACANRYCAQWTLQPYLRAGYPLFP